jgi:hypothetical protein
MLQKSQAEIKPLFYNNRSAPAFGKQTRSGLYNSGSIPEGLDATYQVHDEEMSEDDAGAEHAGQQHV